MAGFDLERDMENAGIDAFAFSIMDEDERREALEEAGLDPDFYLDADLDDDFIAWEKLQTAGLSLFELELMDEDELREALEEAGLDPSDYEDVTDSFIPWVPPEADPAPAEPPRPNAAEEPPPQEQPAPVSASEDLTVYRYLQVRFSSGSQLYAYRTDDQTIRAGDRVIVPVGGLGENCCVTVVAAGDYTLSTAPYPPDKTKFILCKAAEEEPAATPRRTVSTPGPTKDPDPFHARDYAFPEDFYYDYYDDFWDYEDAEDYWEEWND